MMGWLDIFKPGWTGKDMGGEDRKKLFWLLKRKTSYTAWKREADAFDRFAKVFERQVTEEPHAAGMLGGTSWHRRYPEVLKAQVLYQKALAQLRAGDRSVFLYDNRGLMGDASTIAQSWHVELVNHGPQGDHFPDGKYVEALTAAIAEYYQVSRDSGYLEPAMAGGAAPEVWTTFWREEFARIPFPASLDEVPAPTGEVLVRSGEPVPVFGIYEPQTKDGCMNYLLAGTLPAPTLHQADGTYLTGARMPVVWRLLWTDERYLDGTIPAEENAYFPS